MTKPSDTSSRPLPALKFKGRRSYLHGTDIFTACMNVLLDEYPFSYIENIDIVFRGLTKTSLVMCPKAAQEGQAKVQLSCVIDGMEKRYVLLESDIDVDQRIEYPEDVIVAATHINLETATAISTGVLGFTNIERWVAMVKALHLSLYPALSGKWLFVRGMFSEYRECYGPDVQHTVVLQSNFNNKLTRTAVLIDGQNLGNILFSSQ